MSVIGLPGPSGAFRRRAVPGLTRDLAPQMAVTTVDTGGSFVRAGRSERTPRYRA